GRGLDDGLADRGIGHRLEVLVRLLAGFDAPAQGLGVLYPELDRALGRSLRHDQHDRLQLVFEGLALLLTVAARGLDGVVHVLFADLEFFLVAPAHETGPHHLGLDAGPQRLGPDALLLKRLGQLSRSDVHALAHAGVSPVDVRDTRIDAELLALLDLHLFV